MTFSANMIQKLQIQPIANTDIQTTCAYSAAAVVTQGDGVHSSVPPHNPEQDEVTVNRR